ncbi:uncharacterized protein [Montipora capricornis]|uniref:uncharacterized protein n=1 Tax=Montipora capricornis TaxID=246305 RepID=UPI0035F1F001
MITRQSDSIIKNNPTIGRFFSDHAAVLCDLSSIKPEASVKTVTYRNFKSVNIESFKSDLANSALCNENVVNLSLDDLVSCCNSTLSSLIESHAPLKSKTVVNRPRVPWFNDSIKAAIRERRKAERKWRASKDPTHYSVFKLKKNHATLLMNQARCHTTMSSSRKTESKTLSLPGGSNAEAVANNIGRFFIDKVTSIHSKLGNAVNSRVSTQDMDNNLAYNSFTSFKSLLVDDVRHIIMRSSKKSCSPDPVPTSLVVECMDVLLPVITLIVNLSLQSGHFPEIWKEAIVTPLLKKCGSDPSNFKNLRPIFPSSLRALLQTRFSCTWLRTICIQCSSLHIGNFTAWKQQVHNDILTNKNKRLVTLLVLLDLSAAFDAVDASILQTRLRSKVGLNGTALSWFCSYLSGRAQRISVQGTLSNVFHLRCGVPQGSYLQL